MKTQTRGITMIEMLTAIAVLSVMTAMSMVSFGNAISRSREQAAINAMSNAASEARQLARKYRQPVRLMITTVGSKRTMQWERLDCSDSWGTVCPTVACSTNACGMGGCVCPQKGEVIEIPAALTLATSLQGLCFGAGSGAPHVVAAGKYCDETAAAPPAPSLTFKAANGAVSQVLELEPLTGNPRLVDCKSAFRDAALCP